MLFDLVPASWRPYLEEFRAEIDEIGSKLQGRADRGERILPDKKNVFRALEVAPGDVRVFILGQDPYPNIQDACGLSFSVTPRASGLPGSLMNIQKEILTDIGQTTTSDGDLSRWMSQGVMLLNRVLTVTAGQSGSHAKLGWEPITRRIAEVVAEAGAIAILWGNAARDLAEIFPPEARIEGVHPSPLSAHRGFLGSKPFSQVNQLLSLRGLEEIIW